MDAFGSSNGTPSADVLHPVLESLNLLPRLRAEAREHAGRHTAEPQEREEKALEAVAESTVAQLPRTPFNPEDPSDAYRHAEYQKDLADRGFADEAVLVARKNARERQRALRGTQPAEEPKIWPIAPVLAVTSLAISFAPTFKDVLFSGIHDQLTGWFLGGLCGATLGGVVTSLQLSEYSSPGEEKGVRGMLGLIGGAGLGVANWMMRAAIANSQRDHFMALGLTVLEIVTVVMLHAYVQHLRGKYHAFLAYETKRNEALQGEEERQLAESHLAAVDKKIDQFRAYVEVRRVVADNRDDVVKAAKAFTYGQYLQKIKTNRDELLG